MSIQIGQGSADWGVYLFWIIFALILLDPRGMSQMLKIVLVAFMCAIGMGIYNADWAFWNWIMALLPDGWKAFFSL